MKEKEEAEKKNGKNLKRKFRRTLCLLDLLEAKIDYGYFIIVHQYYLNISRQLSIRDLINTMSSGIFAADFHYFSPQPPLSPSFMVKMT